MIKTYLNSNPNLKYPRTKLYLAEFQKIKEQSSQPEPRTVHRIGLHVLESNPCRPFWWVFQNQDRPFVHYFWTQNPDRSLHHELEVLCSSISVVWTQKHRVIPTVTERGRPIEVGWLCSRTQQNLDRSPSLSVLLPTPSPVLVAPPSTIVGLTHRWWVFHPALLSRV